MRPSTLACLCLVVGVGGSLFFYRLGDRDLWASHEARAAQDAQRILDDGDWLTPRLFDDQVELQKPPMYYWLAAAAGRWRGGSVDAVAARLPAALAGLATVAAVFAFLAARGRPLAGLIAALLLATGQHFTWLARTGRIDVPLTLTTTAAALCLWSAADAAIPRRRAVALSLAGYLAMAVGVLLKGPLGVILPSAALVADGIVSRRRAIPPTAWWGVPLVLALAGWWFVVAHVRTDGEFTRVFFWYHNVQRATGAAAGLASHPWWFYGPRLAFDFLPWTPLLVPAAWFTCRARGANPDPVARLGWVWLGTITVLLSASRFKRADYLLPAYPGAAVWLGCVAERVYHSWRSPCRARWLSIGGTS
ncbi:MAG TPA: phospholipid carrier-dependent glycosyltransferase, partial [Gemmataceae bacterium]